MARSSRRFFRILAILGLCLLLILSFLPHIYKQELHTRGFLHGPAHLVLFAGLTYLWFKSARSLLQRNSAIAFLMIVALCIELIQHWVVQIPIEWVDITLDEFAVLLVGLGMTLISNRRHHRQM